MASDVGHSGRATLPSLASIHEHLRSGIFMGIGTSIDPSSDLPLFKGLMIEPLKLNASFFHLYGTEHDDAAYILETFPIVKRKELAEYGSYRTIELILDVYDRMTKAIETGRPYQTILDSPPADPSLCHSPRGAPGEH